MPLNVFDHLLHELYADALLLIIRRYIHPKNFIHRIIHPGLDVPGYTHHALLDGGHDILRFDRPITKHRLELTPSQSCEFGRVIFPNNSTDDWDIRWSEYTNIHSLLSIVYTSDMAKRISLILSILAVLIIGTITYLAWRQPTNQDGAVEYAPTINPTDFSVTITNPWLTLLPGKKFTYQGQTAEGIERVEIEITGATKTVLGVETLVYSDRVWLDNELVEDTRDYLAQDSVGNVWYFGEDVDNYENGELIDHEGSWLAGVDGAQPGIWFKANPQLGDTYRQEYLEGEAEDQAEVVAINETVSSPIGEFTGCVKTYDWTPLDTDAQEHKYYCPVVGGLVKEVDLLTNDQVELIAFN